MPTASGVKPISATWSSKAASMAPASALALESAGIPFRAASISSKALSGSRKKSPETCACAKRPSNTSMSTATSFPPRTLYSPRNCGSFHLSSPRRYPMRPGGADSNQLTSPVADPSFSASSQRLGVASLTRSIRTFATA